MDEETFECPDCGTEYDNSYDAMHCCDWLYGDLSEFDVDEFEK